MGYIIKAKTGDEIKPRARKTLARALGIPLALAPSKVEPKTEGHAGQWFCINCGELPQNNAGAWSHMDSKPKHKFAWRSFSSGNIEEP